MLIKRFVIPASLAFGVLALGGCSNMMGGGHSEAQPPAQTSAGTGAVAGTNSSTGAMVDGGTSKVGGMGPAASQGAMSGESAGQMAPKPAAGTGTAQ